MIAQKDKDDTILLFIGILSQSQKIAAIRAFLKLLRHIEKDTGVVRFWWSFISFATLVPYQSDI